jgi:CPA1 family monovalent cation:H+ antiporter
MVGSFVFVAAAWLRKKVIDPLLDTGISFVVPFGRLHHRRAVPSLRCGRHGIAGLLLGHKAPIIQTAQSRIAERANWRTIAFILENNVFLLIRLQARWIITDVGESDVPVGRIAALCAATLVAVVVLRLLWVFPARYLLVRPGPDPATGQKPPAACTT